MDSTWGIWAQLPRMTPNARTATMYPEVLRASITKEIALRHTVGSFDKPPLDNFVCSSLGVRPKKTGAARIIMDLSQPFGALMAKLDVKYAFRIIPIQRKDWNLLGFAHDGKYYFDTVLPFGLQSSPAIFNQLADLLEWLLKVNGDCPDILHYMDDFFIAGAPDTTNCNIAVSYLTALADDIGLPLAPEKTMGPTTTLPFLCIMIDSVKRTLSIPMKRSRTSPAKFRLGKGLAGNSPLYVSGDGSYLTRQRVNQVVKDLLAVSFKSHSFQIGAATTAAEAGIPVDLIRILGR
ncbi:hypothetical protein BV898_00023 [Hypsibius exemplaris]|uniref:Reverse transcriptase domain-containing protein n=1 Tax=Hypsibius exemplaris TaxID=2072580 RepID=A0A1W0XEH3_HYPEX|nr:hypothetical protein BV898_00023 [Hypsibius exemplaris]